MKISHAKHGDHVLITVEMSAANITARGAGVAHVTMEDDEWKATARLVLREYNAIEHKANPVELIQRIRGTLCEAALQSLEPHDADVARRRMVSSVMHRAADMIQSGTINQAAISWDGGDVLDIAISSRHDRETSMRIKRGVGVVEHAPQGQA